MRLFLAVIIALVFSTPAPGAQPAVAAHRDFLAKEWAAVEHAAELNRTSRTEQHQKLSRLSPTDVSPLMLEQAELDVEAARVQYESASIELQASQHQHQELTTRIRELEQRIQQLRVGAAQTNATRDDDAEALEQELEKTRALGAVEKERIALREATVNVARERLDLATTWLSGLKNLERAAQEANQQTVLEDLKVQLERRHQELLGQAAEWRSRLQGLPGTAPEPQRQLLRARLYEAEEKARLAQQAIRLAQFQAQVSGFSELSSDPNASPEALESALTQLKAIRNELDASRSLLNRRVKVLEQQSQVAAKRLAEPEETRAYRRLEQALAGQTAETEALANRIGSLPEVLETKLNETLRRGLTARRPLPTSTDEWRLLFGEVASLPSVLFAALLENFRLLASGAAQLTADRWLMLGLATGFWLLMIRRSQRRLALRPVANHGWSALLNLPLALFERSARPVAAAGTLLLFIWSLTPEGGSVSPLLGLLVGLFALRLLLNLTWALLVAPEEGRRHLQLHHQLKWMILIVGSLGLLAVTVHSLPLSATLSNFVDRLFMLSLLMLAVPTFEVRRLSLKHLEARLGERYWARVIRLFSLLAPISVMGAAAVGVAGFVNLAWAIGGALATVLAVLAAWLVIARLLREAGDNLKSYVNLHTQHGMLLTKGIIEPAYSLLRAVVFLLIWAVPFHIYGIGPETPVVATVWKHLQTPLFSIGDDTVTTFGVILAIAAVIAVLRTGRWLRLITYRWALSGITDQGIRHSLSVFSQYTFVLAGVLITVQLIGLDLTSVAIFAGALGVGIGLGLQNIANNFISGILLLLERPLRTNDIVRVGEYEGEVTHIGMRSLTVKTWDNQEVIMPNANVISNPFTNWTHNDNVVRTVVDIGIAYDADPHRAAEIIAEVLQQNPYVLDDPKPQVWLKEFAASSILFHVQYFIDLKTNNRPEVRSQILMALWDRFLEAGVRIPYPQMDVHLHPPIASERTLEIENPPVHNAATIHQVRPS